jgi:hypothetical protein
LKCFQDNQTSQSQDQTFNLQPVTSDENVQMLKRADVPAKIYIREEKDLVKQLCSIGTKTYMSSHKEPYGGSPKVKTFSDKDYKEWYHRLRI